MKSGIWNCIFFYGGILNDTMNQPCPPGKIRNPASGRCVNINGAIGRRILREQAEERAASERKPRKCPPRMIYSVETDRCVDFDGPTGRRIMKQAEMIHPELQLLPPDIALDVYGYAQTKPQNCGRLIIEMNKLAKRPNKQVLRRSVLKTLDQVQRILMQSFSLKQATLAGQGNVPLRQHVEQLIERAKLPNITVDELIGLCRSVVDIKHKARRIVEQLRVTLQHLVNYTITWKIPANYLGEVVFQNYSSIVNIRRYESYAFHRKHVKQTVRTFRLGLQKDERALARLLQPIQID